MDCGGEVWLGVRLWIVSARVGLARGVDCVDARLWFMSARFVLHEAVGCVGKVGLGARRYRNCVKRRCGKKVRKVANL